MKRCPNCGQPAEWRDNPHRPFCSERCKLIDFGRWANEEYRVPAEPALDANREEDDVEHRAPADDEQD